MRARRRKRESVCVFNVVMEVENTSSMENHEEICIRD
jgi:hypothetical protein